MGRSKVDLSGIKQYRDNLIKLQKETDTFFEKLAKELAARFLRKAIKRTPVGKRPKLEGQKTMKVEGKSGKKRSFLSPEAVRLKEHWSGYNGGTLRRGWTAKSEAEAVGGGEENVLSFAKSLDVKRVGKDYQITIINPVSYASYVEYGHRQQAGRFVPQLGKRLKKSWVEGQFMMTISEMELREEAPAIIERKIAAFLRGTMNGK